MISFDLSCSSGHRFEGWFRSGQDYDQQHVSGMLDCPVCGNTEIMKMLSVPNVGRKGNQQSESSAPPTYREESHPVANRPSLTPEMMDLMGKLAKAQAEMLDKSEWVGEDFAESARAIHYGEAEDRLIHGQTTLEEAEELSDEGIQVAPLPFPLLPPEAKN